MMNRSVVGSGLAVVTLALLAACSDDTDAPAAASGGPTAGVSSSASAGWEPVPLDGEYLPAGRLGMTANGRADAPWAVVTVPDRFSTLDGWVIFDEDPQGGGGVGYWTISEVVRDPCGPAPHPIKVGDTVEDVVAAFGKQRISRVTEPVPVAVDGHRGVSFSVAVPPRVDFATCPDFNLWESDPAGARHMGGPGEYDTLWVLDVDGEVLVLTVTADTDVPASAVRQLTGIVESAEFVPRA